MAAAVGNQYARKARIWEQAIKRALARLSNENVDKGLDRLADKLVAQAADGDTWALREVGDRLDGKPVASTEISGPEGGDIPLGGLGAVYGVQPTPKG